MLMVELIYPPAENKEWLWPTTPKHFENSVYSSLMMAKASLHEPLDGDISLLWDML